MVCLNDACIVYSCFAAAAAAAAGARVGRKYSEWCVRMSTRFWRHFKSLTIVRIQRQIYTISRVRYPIEKASERESAGRLSE